MKMRNASINFLISDNRSGSTFLSALLDSFDEIGVTLESPILFYLITGKKIYRTEYEINRMLKHIYADPKFNEWDVPPRNLKKRLIDDLPLSRRDFIYSVLEAYFNEAYFNHKKPKCWIYEECSPWWMKEIKEALPEAKFIFIYRDGRAVFSSKKRAISSYTGEVMDIDPIHAARTWCRFIDIIEKMPFQNDIVRVKYENLIIQTKIELEKLYNFLFGERYTGRDYNIDTVGYYSKIPASQVHLHHNVAKKPLKSRIDGWKDEITYAEGYLYERAAGRMLTQMGYELQYLNKSMSEDDKKELKLLYMKRFYWRCLHLARRFLFYSSHLDAIWRLIYKIQKRP